MQMQANNKSKANEEKSKIKKYRKMSRIKVDNPPNITRGSNLATDLNIVLHARIVKCQYVKIILYRPRLSYRFDFSTHIYQKKKPGTLYVIDISKFSS